MGIKGKVKSDSVIERRLSLINDIKVKISEARYNLTDDSHQRVGFERMQKIQWDIKCERTVGRNGGSFKWPVHILLFICELPINGTSPSSVAANIQTISATIT